MDCPGPLVLGIRPLSVMLSAFPTSVATFAPAGGYEEFRYLLLAWKIYIADWANLPLNPELTSDS